MIHRLQMLNAHAKVSSSSSKPLKSNPTLDVWQSMGLDAYLSPVAIKLRDKAAKITRETEHDLLEHVDNSTFPTWIISKVQELGPSGLYIKGHGGLGLTLLE